MRNILHDNPLGFTMQVESPVTDSRDTRVETGALGDPLDCHDSKTSSRLNSSG